MSAESTVLADEFSRTRISSQLDQTLFVDAGAGTGKTTELVNRVLALVRSGVEMRRIAAITFTEAAASELRDRLRDRLELAAADGDAAAQAAVADVDDAAVSTLHAFAQRILLEHALEAGLPPVFEIRDEIQSSLAFDDWWSATLDELLDAPELRTSWHRILALGLTADRFSDLARIMHAHWDRLERAPANGSDGGGASEAEIERLRLRAVSALGTAAAFGAECKDDEDKLSIRLRQFAAAAAVTDGPESAWLARFAALPGRDRETTRLGSKKNWPAGIDQARHAAQDAQDAVNLVIATIFDVAARSIAGRIAGAVLRAAGERRATGELEFHDLLVLARGVMRDHEGVVATLRNRWHRILIDEFQDTDPIQVEIAARLATLDADVSAESLPELEPGKVFFVGDARQSIYRFRRADVELFRSVAGQLEDSIVYLTQNFRSVPGITDWVNAVMKGLLGADYIDLVPARARTGGSKGPAAVRVLGGAHDDKNLPTIRAEEAGEIAATIHHIVGHGGFTSAWQVGHGERHEQLRDARFDDVAILLPTRTSLDYLEKALEEQQIPYRVESASLIWATQEVRDLVSILRAIDDAGDDVSVVAALRSPAIGCSDEDLLEWTQAGGRWRVDAKRPEALPIEHPVHLGLTRLEELAAQRWWAGVSGIVERAARRFGFFELALSHTRARDSWRRLRHVIDEARRFEVGEGSTLRQFLAWAEAQQDEGARVKEVVLPEPDYPAVRIFTVHGAKGLEFPVCILSGLNAQPARRGLGQVLWAPDGRMEVYFNRDLKTLGWDGLAVEDRRQEQAEARRLLYVAATRAKDHLLVSLHHKAGRDCHAATLIEQCDRHPELWERLTLGLSLLPGAPSPAAPTTDLAGERRRWSSERSRRIADLRRAPVRAATELKDRSDDPVEKLPWQRGRGGTSLGRAVHATLQTVDLASRAGLTETARAQAAAEGIAHRGAEVEARARAALASGIAAEASKARHWRELYVGAPIDDLTVEGYVDLLYEGPDGLVLVDWKTDAIDPHAEQAEAIGRYGEQIAAYAAVLEATLGRPVTRAVLVFLSAKEAVEVDVSLSEAQPGLNSHFAG